jgi:hypothetical protein
MNTIFPCGIKVIMYKKSRTSPAAPSRVSGRTTGPPPP